MSVRIVTGAAFAVLALAGCNQNAASTLAAGESGRMTVADQPAGQAVVLEAVGMPSTGWVVLHAMQGGQPDTSGSIGHAYVQAGPSGPVSVPLSAPVQPGQQVAVMLHLDTGNATVFEWGINAPEPLDPPVVAEGAPVMTVITLR